MTIKTRLKKAERNIIGQPLPQEPIEVIRQRIMQKFADVLEHPSEPVKTPDENPEVTEMRNMILERLARVGTECPSNHE